MLCFGFCWFGPFPIILSFRGFPLNSFLFWGPGVREKKGLKGRHRPLKGCFGCPFGGPDRPRNRPMLERARHDVGMRLTWCRDAFDKMSGVWGHFWEWCWGVVLGSGTWDMASFGMSGDGVYGNGVSGNGVSGNGVREWVVFGICVKVYAARLRRFCYDVVVWGRGLFHPKGCPRTSTQRAAKIVNQMTPRFVVQNRLVNLKWGVIWFTILGVFLGSCFWMGFGPGSPALEKASFLCSYAHKSMRIATGFRGFPYALMRIRR